MDFKYLGDGLSKELLVALGVANGPVVGEVYT